MKAWQFTNTNEPLVLNEVPEPKAGPGEVVLEMKAAGICHSDVGLLTDEGWLSMLAKRPITIGHENSGVVAEVGEGVTEYQVGDRVGVCPTTAAGAPGYSFDGGFAPKMAVPAEALVPLPDEVDFILGAAATDAGMTSHAAVVTQGGLRKGQTVGIIGLGGLGQIGARVAVLAGADVYVAEINEKVWPLAEKIGAKGVKKGIKDFSDITFDLIVDFAGFGTTTADAVDVIRRDGTVVVVGMGKLESLISTKSLILNQCRLIGSNGGTKADIAGVYDFMATGKLAPQVTTIPFEEIPEGIEKLKNHEVVGRLVVEY
ncbi:zinc-binding dehydrogenase [Actinotignum sanguinis]|uniref:alcohol dehydrogenase n=3 Tax=Actinomycetaceae TaxID=2049 RepID=A0ABZ0RDL1_9ACTO|nr:zinc-binding dehydrogenase [Actinotignum sanguinis]WPJ89145.1 zinc-binding dehydrogenase [Schaalia turicensis]MDE1564751.1 zinc-binding dehydrogenase [Actinotignum sanguinis]MDE1576786.1 zinc-binding dehydrogenase [Actinotignum sanguinis]MDE1642354.1 zinc-binding dehydrogenase [Actinotignum sanguinis]MDE1655795.1 zinc-binding dehydrogenase [Actinotignum sanguinis]